MTFTFTETLPTRDGYFLWKQDEGGVVLMADVWRGQDGIMYADSYKSYAETVAALGGLWCLLVPAEEIERTWNEAMEAGDDIEWGELKHDEAWPNSRAKRVAEGLE